MTGIDGEGSTMVGIAGSPTSVGGGAVRESGGSAENVSGVDPSNFRSPFSPNNGEGIHGERSVSGSSSFLGERREGG